MSIKALQEYTRFSRYARYIPELKRRETWEEQVNRVFDMHIKHLGQETIDKFKDDFNFAKQMVMQKRVLGSQRALQFGGKPILDKNLRLYNCSSSYCDRVRFFQECIYLLLCGCGAGFSVQKHHVDKLPLLISPYKLNLGTKTFVIPDSIEGWADAVGVLMSSYFDDKENLPFPEYHGYKIEFDYSQIRPAGAPISSGSKAPGPDGLKAALIKIDYLLDKSAKERDKLRPIDAYDIVMHLSDAVLSGGVRRSATLAIFSHDDEEMLKAKTGRWRMENPQRGRSNNSALLVRDEISKDEFKNVINNIKEYGEPGFIWADSKDFLANPCVTDDTWVMTKNGPLQVIDLIGKKTKAYIDGKLYSFVSDGFFETGTKDVYKIITKEGFSLNVTDNHDIKLENGDWITVKNLKNGDKIKLHHHANITWEGKQISLEYNLFDYNGLKEIVSTNTNNDININDDIEKTSSSFYINFIKDTFKFYGKAKNNSLYLKINNPEKMQRMLLRLGIYSIINKNKEIIIEGKEIITFDNKIGLNKKIKSQLSSIFEYQIQEYKTNFVATFEKIEYLGKKKVYDCTIENIHAFDANGLYVHNCVEIGMYAKLILTEEMKEEYKKEIKIQKNDKELSGWQNCVSADTKLITKNGISNIKEQVGKKTIIWNGGKWREVKPFKTGENRKLYRVLLSDGSYLDCTDNHKWVVKDDFMKDYIEVETKDLMTISKQKLYAMPSNIKFSKGINKKHAYAYGFIFGEGKENNQISQISFDLLEKSLISKRKNNELPQEIFTWNRKSLLDFIAGWIDANGVKIKDGVKIYGIKSKINDLQLLITKLGIYSKKEKYNEQDIWQLQINNMKDIYSYKFTFDTNNEIEERQIIKSVTELDGLHDTYCLEEKEQHLCVFNNVLTHQCNLCEINIKKVKTEQDFLDACKAAAIIGTIQSTYNHFPYIGKVSSEIQKSEALLGVSMTGMADNPDIAFNPKVQRKGAKLILEINEQIANIVGINMAARSTCVKPAGSTSCILGSASGIHPHHAKRYFRRVQANKLEAPLQYFSQFNPLAVEESVWSSNKTDMIITFLCEVPDGAKTKNQVDALTLLENVKLTQQNWVMSGKREDKCLKPWLSHNVSNTISIKEEEWDDVTKYIYRNKSYFTGVAMIPMSGDKDYPQAPFTAVYTPNEMVRIYGDGSMFASGLIVDGLKAFDNNLWAACDCLLGIGEVVSVDALKDKITNDCLTNGAKWKKEGLSALSPKTLLLAWLKENIKNYKEKQEWLRRAKQFAKRYFNNDIKLMTYCLKDISNWKTWCDLQREYVEVDWSQCFESEANDMLMEGAGSACAGGKCDLGELGLAIEAKQMEQK